MLRDALGSTIGLVNAAGTIATSYGYEPFGATAASGAASSNSQGCHGGVGNSYAGGGVGSVRPPESVTAMRGALMEKRTAQGTKHAGITEE
jgi:hypothetical protein